MSDLRIGIGAGGHDGRAGAVFAFLKRLHRRLLAAIRRGVVAISRARQKHVQHPVRDQQVAFGVRMPDVVGIERGRLALLRERIEQVEVCDALPGQKNADLRMNVAQWIACLLYTSPSPRDISGSRMPSSA